MIKNGDRGQLVYAFLPGPTNGEQQQLRSQQCRYQWFRSTSFSKSKFSYPGNSGNGHETFVALMVTKNKG